MAKIVLGLLGAATGAIILGQAGVMGLSVGGIGGFVVGGVVGTLFSARVSKTLDEPQTHWVRRLIWILIIGIIIVGAIFVAGGIRA